MAKVIEEVKKSPKKTIDRFCRSSYRSKNRSVTDKYWCFLFIFIFIIWIASCYYVNYHRRPHSKIDSDNITTTKNATELDRYYLWGKNWLFDMITCNVAFVGAHYESSGPLVIGANVLLSIGLIAYSISSMRNTNTFQSQLEIACLYFIGCTVIYRFFIFVVNSPRPCSIIAISPSQEKVVFWLMPELIFIMVWYTKQRYTDDHLLMDYNEMNNSDCGGLLILLVPNFPLSMLFHLYVYIANTVYELGWDCALSYVIVGGSCYIALTIFYFWLLATSCTIDMALDYKHEVYLTKDFRILADFFRALVIVGRYHFGTACYHATLIFPRLDSLFVMNEPEFKKIPKFAKITDRFYATHCKLHNLTLMSTAVGGTNHSESLRELLHHFATDLPPKLEYFQGFSQITRCLLALLMSTNSLMLISLWACGLHDPRLSLATWVFYLRLIIVFNVPMKVLDMVMDTIFLQSKYEPRTYFDLIAIETDTDEDI